ncbi:hypothetical protein PENTCL1PPCAC_16588, partial [Pristionchus entomophagus]
ISFALSCSHSFCSECWLQHIQKKTSSNRPLYGELDNGCTSVLTIESASNLLSPESALVYQQFLESSFAIERKLLCPSCDKALPATSSRSIVCECGTVVCSGCSSPDHRPVPCSVYAEYTAVKEGRDATSDNDLWFPLLKDLSKCPKCGTYAVKDG